MAELLGLAAACFLAYLHLRPEQTALAVAVATLANTAGGMTSYLIGRLIPQKRLDSRALPGSGVRLLRRCHISMQWSIKHLFPLAPSNLAGLGRATGQIIDKAAEFLLRLDSPTKIVGDVSDYSTVRLLVWRALTIH